MGRADGRIVGLDLGASGIRAVEVRHDRKQPVPEVHRAAWADLPRGAIRNGRIEDPDTVARTIRQVWRAGRFSTRRVAFGLADNGILTRQLTLPWMAPADFKAALRYQIQDALPVDTATVELDYHLLAEVHRQDAAGHAIDENTILVVAANREATAAEAGTIRRARLEPVLADSSAFALIRAACHGRLPQTQSTSAIVDVGAEQLTVIVHSAGQPRFIRTVGNLGGDTATQAVADALGLDLDEAEALKRTTGLSGPAPVVAAVAESSIFSAFADTGPTVIDPRTQAAVAALNPWATTLVSEIRNSVDYYLASGQHAPIEEIVLCGRTAQLGGLVERIGTSLPYAVRPADRFMGLPASPRLLHEPPSDSRLAVAIGLALGVV